MAAEPGVHKLSLWADDQKVALLGYAPLDDRWTLDYTPEWVQWDGGFPLSPCLPFAPLENGYASGAVKRFVENLLPEGRALDISAAAYRVSKANIFGLINALGAETAGAFRFWPVDVAPPPPTIAAPPLREVTVAELNERLATRNETPFVVWDGKVRMSIAGYQDKLLVYLDQPLASGGRMFLVEPPLASTHILKPQPDRADTPHLVVNEHYCMSLARRMGMPAAEVSILRTPRPLLVVKRFDRVAVNGSEGPGVRRLHIVDACQASDLPVSHKYERNLGNASAVRQIREGVGFEMLFNRVDQTVNKAASKLVMLRWALFQFVIGNSDAHGKNFSFFVARQGLHPAPWYDLVSVAQYPRIDDELAMAFGDAFTLKEVSAFALADFAKRCRIDRGVLKREAAKMARQIALHAARQAGADDYVEEERGFAAQLRDFIMGQGSRLSALAAEAATVRDGYL
jgi:serine/threonine-protein kinase HipA